jgi:glycolate oxidase FAD binding subunit
LIFPSDERELAEALGAAAGAGETIRLGGAFSKDRMTGAGRPATRTISATSLNRVLEYEPRDLTISVESGLAWAQFDKLLAGNRQTIPLDPPYSEQATVGGVIASNASGPRRRMYGTARDLVIGMRFATLEGKVAQTGGMVVKNVAGLDMAKLLIGSFGTLAAIASINFKLIPLPLEQRTFVLTFDTAEAAIAARDQVLAGVLQPAAVDLLNPAASSRLGLSGYALLIEAGGNGAMMARYERELATPGLAEFDWTAVREFTPRFLKSHPQACVARVSTTLTRLSEVIATEATAVLARAANGVSYVHFESPDAAREWADRAATHHLKFVFEYGIQRDSAAFAADFAMMEKVKNLFDPGHLLNPGRMYGRI